MRNARKAWRWAAVGLISLACWLTGGKAWAAATNPAVLDIDVTIQQNLSVLVSTGNTYVQYSTQAITWNLGNPNQKFANDNTTVGVSTVGVQNNSGAQTERWQLSRSNTVNSGVTYDWALRTTTGTMPGAEQFAVQAVFGSSNTAVNGC